MDVDALRMVALLTLIAAWAWLVAARRRAARRRAAARARSMLRRRRVPAVSANVRGLRREETDLWVRETSAMAKDPRRAGPD